jgi:diaminopimelate decarboxylase
MDCFTYQDGQLYCEDLSIDDLAKRVGTPVYVYSAQTLTNHYKAIAAAFAALKPIICYSIKSCGNLNICQLLADLGCGMDVVSGGELYRVQQAGADMSRIVYAGVGKTDTEIRDAIEAQIGYFNIESEAEFQNTASIAQRMGKSVRAALRINPDVDPKTHTKTTTGKKESKFGVDLERARKFFQRFGRDKHLRLTGVHLHIGSPIYSPEPYAQAISKALELIEQLQSEGFTIDTIDIGGGFGADYESGQTPSYEQYAETIVPLLKPFADSGGTVILEPGRTIAANAGTLIMQVQYIKIGGRKKFVIVDSGMHHLIRPTLYEAWQFVWPTQVAPAHQPQARLKNMEMPGLETCDVVGPICETGDYLALDRPLPPVARGDLLAVFGAGAYGMVMASNYNAMPRPAEVLVRGHNATVIRQRETYEDLVALERQAQSV